MAKIFVVHEARPERAYLVPEHWLDNPQLSKGLRRVVNGEVEFDKAVLEVDTSPATIHAADNYTQPAREANTEEE